MTALLPCADGCASLSPRLLKRRSRRQTSLDRAAVGGPPITHPAKLLDRTFKLGANGTDFAPLRGADRRRLVEIGHRFGQLLAQTPQFADPVQFPAVVNDGGEGRGNGFERRAAAIRVDQPDLAAKRGIGGRSDHGRADILDRARDDRVAFKAGSLDGDPDPVEVLGLDRLQYRAPHDFDDIEPRQDAGDGRNGGRRGFIVRTRHPGAAAATTDPHDKILDQELVSHSIRLHFNLPF
ncbi:hypothetical protein PE067_06445 [Paracoccus sp. DMF-8]|uniref:hypothetical protein n=1 Tax=Paracoccus sp. DMF-8 TaxID=3019445 RepID=UPI0023E79AA2|nr:hypothetical protein [Paracoccus sp. DMF-8]MDF3605816.1 hypothetical protein [Paracoccus sp. DMF-8]